MTLYAILPGSSCVLSAAGILKGTVFPANAVAESDTRILLVPGAVIKRLYGKYPGWRDFILSLYTERVSKDFENRGFISQSRGLLQIEAPEGLGTIISQ